MEIISIMRVSVIVMWIIISILNSRDFDSRSIIIWIATAVIAIAQIDLISR